MNIPQQEQQEQEQQEILAVTPLSETADAANRMLLSQRALHIYHKGKPRAFGLEYLKGLALEHRKLWLPLIGGGILASLCALALLHTFSMPYRLLTGVALGVFGMWWGLRGSMALVVYEQRHRTDFLIQRPGSSLPVFIAFANRLIRRYPHGLGAYGISIGLEELQALQQQGALSIQTPRPCMPQELAGRLQQGPGQLILLIDPLRMGQRLHWSLQGQELSAHFKGKLFAAEVALPGQQV